MLRQDSPGISPDLNGAPQPPAEPIEQAKSGVDIQRELNRLEEIVLDSPRIPLTHRTLIDEEQLLDQLDLVRLSLPTAFRDAEALVRRQAEILTQAQQYAEEIVVAAENRAAQILDETGIVQQAEMEARRIFQQVQQECDAMREQVAEELDRMQARTEQEIQEMRRQALAERDDIQAGADDYADRVLGEIERQLSDMLRVIHNGRQQLRPVESGHTPEPTPKAPQRPSGGPSQPPRKR